MMVPGYTGSGPDHWQSLWQLHHPEYRRVEQRDWDHPERDEWVSALNESILAIQGPILLVAHSLGCHTVAWWAGQFHADVFAAMLVAPSDPDEPNFPSAIRGFHPVKLQRFSFPGLVVASTNDPLVTVERANFFADSWGCDFKSVVNAGHIATADGYGAWNEGHVLLENLKILNNGH
ncbi:alpha/beta hydrolase [bacterium]|nr:alpha/beta hydrolase [bacterium]